jgi:hypothetical protein
VVADEKFSDKFVVGAVHCFMSRDVIAGLTEELRFETMIHGLVRMLPANKQESVRNLIVKFRLQSRHGADHMPDQISRESCREPNYRHLETAPPYRANCSSRLVCANEEEQCAAYNYGCD